jgi:hypothetical protein
MDVSVLMAGSTATLIVRTGGYDETTGEQDPNGTFDKIQYKIYDAKGKLVSTTNDNGASGVVYRTNLPSGFRPDYRVEVQANIKDHSGKKGTAVVRGAGTPTAAPDLDLSAEAIEQIVNGQRVALAPVLAGSTNTYVADVTNASATGIAAVCTVSVDGVAQTAGQNGFTFVSPGAIFVGPAQSKPCSFTLTLAEGSHSVTVAAVVAGGYVDANPDNNSVTATVEAQKPADVAVTNLVSIVNGAPVSPLADVVAGATADYKATVSLPAASLGADVSCSVLIDGVAVAADRIQWTRDAFPLAAGESNTCEFSLTFPAAGTFTIKVVATAPGDPNPANDFVAGAQLVKPVADANITTDIVVRSLTSFPPVLSGAEQEFVAKIGVNAGGSESTANFVCSVTVTRTSGQPFTGTILWAKQDGGATLNDDDECRFRLIGLVSNGGADDTYRVTLTATAANANELAGRGGDNSRTVDQVVRAVTVDLDVLSLQRSNPGDGLPWVAVDSVLAGPTFTYRAFIGTIAGSAAVNSATFTCSAEISAAGVAPQTIPGAVSGPATTAGTATCSFPLPLAANGNEDRDYTIRVTVTPVGATELAAANNAESFGQKAIVRADIGVLVDRIILAVGTSTHPCIATSGLCSLLKTDTISVGQTGNFTAFLHNYSADKSASVTCTVLAGVPGATQTPIPAAPAQAQIGPGGEVSCAFAYAFAERVAMNFTVIATALSPKDNQRANDTVHFTMAPVQNIVFPNLQFADAVIEERGFQVGSVVTELYKQTTSITRVFITFTNKTAVIGDFTFTGKVFTYDNPTPFSQGVFHVTGLLPGGLNNQRNCVGVGGPGATVVSSSPPNDHFIDMQICAEESPADPTQQLISVTYNSTMEGTHTGTDLLNVGPTVTFDLKLQWVLSGNLPDQVSTATGKVRFDVVRDALVGAYFKHQNGNATIIP